MKRILLLGVLYFCALPVFSQSPGSILEENFFGANFLLNGDAELGPVDVPAFGYRPPYEGGLPQTQSLRGEIRISPWGSTVNGYQVVEPVADGTDFGNQFLWGAPAMHSQLNKNITVRDFADAFADGSITLYAAGWFGGIAGQQDSVRLEIDILDSGRRRLSRSVIGNVTPEDRNGQTGMLFDEISIVIPEGASGIETRFIMADGGLADNLQLVFLSDNHPNTYTLPADLHVPRAEAPAGGFSGATVDLEWTVENRGETATSAQWVDRVILSTEPSATRGTQYNLGEFSNVQSLEPDEVYTVSQTVTLPELLQGPYYLLVQTDARQRIPEYTTANNTSEPIPITLTTSPYPDLQVSSVLVTPTAFSGDSIDVSWTVTNQGTGPTSPSRWTDAVYLGTGEALDFNFFGLTGNFLQVNDHFVTSFEHVGALRPGESYTVTRRIRLPDHLTGSQRLFVFTDKPDGRRTPRNGDVFEFLFPLNNWSSAPIDIILTPPPDLTLSEASLSDFPADVANPDAPLQPGTQQPAQLTSGQEYAVRWTTANEGPGATRAPVWQDAVFLSTEADFDTTTANLLRTATIEQADGLLSDTSVDTETIIRIPDGVEGTYYLHLFTNYTRQVFEHTFTDNNVRTLGPVDVELNAYPDLAATQVNVAGEAAAGELLRVDWEVTNTGEATATGLRTDRFYLSETAEFDADNAIQVGSHNDAADLEVGSARQLIHRLRIPPSVSEGNYYLFVLANADSTIFEWPASGNNVSGTASFQVAPYAGATLAVSAIETPEQGISGEPIDLRWTVENTGSGSMLNQPWTEQVMLIPQDSTAESAIILSEVVHASGLQSGEQRQRNRSFRVPDGLDQPHYAAISLTYPVVGTNLSETVTAWSDTPIAMDPGPRRDLVIINSDVPDSVAPGEIRTVSWTVRNQGEHETGDIDWFDTIYLVENPDDALLQRPLARWSHTGGLQSDSSYTATVEIEVPVQLDGDHFWVIKTDTRNRVYEYQAAENNTLIVPVTPGLTPTTDLVVSDILIPENTVAGEPFTVQWEIQNTGANTARGRIRDGVYLVDSRDDDRTLGNAILLGVAERDIDLAPGERMRMQQRVDASQTAASHFDGTLTSPMPGVDPGFYQVGIRTNIRTTIPETDLSNNTLFSTDSLEVRLPSLTADTQVQTLFQPGDARYFTFDAPAGQDLLFTARTEDGSVATLNLFVSYGETPTRVRHDRSATQPFTSPQSLAISDSREGTYYAMVQMENSNTDTTAVTLDVQVRGFEIREVLPALGGNVGPVTVRIHGSRFTDSTMVYMQDPSGTRIEAFETVLRSRNEILARFQLDGADIGMYDMVAVTPDGLETRLTDGFEIITGSGPDVQTLVQSPNFIRSQEEYEFTVTIINNGDTNALDHFVMVELFGINAVGFEGNYDPVQFVRIDEQFPELVHDMPRGYQNYGHTMQIGDAHVIPYWFYEIPPGARVRFRVRVMHDAIAPPPETGGMGGTITHSTKVIPMPESDFTRSGARADIESAVGFRILNDMYERLVDDLFEAAAERTMMKDAGYQGLVDLVTIFADGGKPTFTGVLGTAAGGAAGYLLVAALYTNPATGLLATGFALGTMVSGTLLTMQGTINTRDAAIEQGTSLIQSQLDPLTSDRNRYVNSFSTTQAVESKDPNDIIGPEGFGEERWIGITQPLEYKIRYENDPELASAPAQIVRIVHPLDETADIRAFRLGTFGFADTTFSVPDNVSTYSARLDLRASMGLFVDVVAGIDVQSREAIWLFRSIDPATGDIPVNPLVGYLAVNDSTGVGEGFVNYSIRANPQAVTGDEIHAEASIFFDSNPPIDTPPIFNTVDADLPESDVLVSVEDDVFEITWSGSDQGAGFSRADLYVSVDDGPFERVIDVENDGPHYLSQSTTASAYRFFTLAFDHAGNREPMKTGADALTVTSADPAGSDLPREFAVKPVYPNPFNPTTSLPFDMPSAGDVSITVYDILGRSMLSVQLNALPAGRHQQMLNMQRFASGVYFAEISVLAEDGQRWQAVQPMTLIK